MRAHAIVAVLAVVVGVEGGGGPCNHGHRTQKAKIWVHVGKTGTAVASMLQGCTVVTCHGRAGRLTPPVPRHARYLIGVRDPVARVVSAFNWRHPNNTRNGKIHGHIYPHIELKLYACFPTVDAFALGIVAAGPCGDLARKFLSVPRAHITEGLEFYVGSVLDKGLLDRPYALLHTERLAADVAAAARWLGCRFRYRHEHGHYRTRNATFLSPAGRANLRTAFRREYEVLAALEAGPGRVALA